MDNDSTELTAVSNDQETHGAASSLDSHVNSSSPPPDSSQTTPRDPVERNEAATEPDQSRPVSRVPTQSFDRISQGPLEDRLVVAKRYFIMGCFGLPLVWALNALFFRKSFREYKDSNDPQAQQLLSCTYFSNEFLSSRY